MGTLMAIPVLGWFIAILIGLCWSIPFYFLWNSVAPTYFYWLPRVYHQLPFWDCVKLTLTISMMKVLLFPTMSVNNSNGKKE